MDLNHYLIDKGFKYTDGAKFRGYVATDAEPLCVQLLNKIRIVGVIQKQWMWLKGSLPILIGRTIQFLQHIYLEG
jgi:hypothetical protein